LGWTDGKQGGGIHEKSPFHMNTNISKVSSHGKRPRIILSIRHYFPDGGGAEVLAHRLAVRLVEKGLSVTVLTGRYGRKRSSEVLDGVSVHRHFIGAYVPVLHEICYLMSFAWELVARRYEYDVVHVFISSVIAKRLGKKIITTSHCAKKSGDMAVWYDLPMGKRLLAAVCSSTDVATAVSNDVMNELHEAGFDPQRIHYIPNGVSVNASLDKDQRAFRAKLGLPSEAFIGVFVGRLTPQKAPEFLVDTWASIPWKAVANKLLLIGEGEKQMLLEKRIKENGLEDSVVLTGKVENVEDYLKAADVFILPSVTEGMSMALLEAMATGLPIVASRVSGTVDVIKDGENGLLFESGDREGLIRCLRAVTASSALREGLGEKARETVEQRFSLDRMVDRYITLYCSVFYGTAKLSSGFDVEMFQSKSS
jgi:glycosyltransferase involved in cell wall biosynthesis